MSTYRLLALLAAFAATTTLTLAASAPPPAKARIAALAVPSIAA